MASPVNNGTGTGDACVARTAAMRTPRYTMRRTMRPKRGHTGRGAWRMPSPSRRTAVNYGVAEPGFPQNTHMQDDPIASIRSEIPPGFSEHDARQRRVRTSVDTSFLLASLTFGLHPF